MNDSGDSVKTFFTGRAGASGKPWQVRSMTAREAGLVNRAPDAVLGCGDGRVVDAADTDTKRQYDEGPKLFGATGGVAILTGNGSRQGIIRAIERIRKAGIIPGVHGPHCGQNAVWEERHYTQLPQLEITPESINHEVLSRGGKFVNHMGQHRESGLVVNMIPGMTRIPDGRYFEEDWDLVTLLKLDPAKTLDMIATTVEVLKPDAQTVYVVTG